jgi:nitroreductase
MTEGPILDVFEAMGTARAMRRFRRDPVSTALVEQAVWAATRASSPNNTQPWEFVVVRDQGQRRRVAEALPVGDNLPELADPSERRRREAARDLRRNLAEVPALCFVCGWNSYPENDPQIELMYSAVFAAGQNFIVAARALGLGAAFTTMHRLALPAIRKILDLPDGLVVGITIPFGWPAGPEGPVSRRPIHAVLHHDRW